MKKKNSYKEYAAALYEITKGLEGKALSQALQEFVKLLARANKLKKAPLILESFEKYYQKKHGIIPLEVTTAKPLSEENKKKIIKVFGSKAELTETTDPSIIGGVIIKTEDIILDGSLKKQLQLLKTQLTA
jgi:F-type H+-transporting ATPase subunit delta